MYAHVANVACTCAYVNISTWDITCIALAVGTFDLNHRWDTNDVNTLSLFRRKALSQWKQNLGFDATYRKLMGVFQCAGYKNYADLVNQIAADSDSDMDTDDSSCSDGDYPQQPPSYLPQEPYTTQSTFQVASSQDKTRYVLVDPSQVPKKGNDINF